MKKSIVKQQQRRRSTALINAAFEGLETRRLLAAPVLDSIANQTIPAGRTLQVPLTATDADGDPITYTFSASNANVTTKLHAPTNQYLRLTVTGNGISGTMTFQLFNDGAPRTAGTIAGLAQAGFYNGLTFHRIVKGFVIQGGDPKGNGQGGPGFQFDDEINKDLIYSGDAQLAMARSDRDSNGSQFFVTDGNQRQSLDYQYSLFGQLIRGRDVLTKILNTPVSGSTPVTKVTITSAQVITDTTDGVVQLTAGTGTGTTDVTVTAHDSHGQTAQRTFTVTRIADAVNDPPFLGAVGDRTMTKNGTLNITLTGTDVDNEAKTFATAVIDANGQASTNATATISGNVLTVKPKKDYTGPVYVIVGVTDPSFKDGQGGAQYDKQTIRIGVGDKSASDAAPGLVHAFEAGAKGQGIVLGTFKDSDTAGVAADWTVKPVTNATAGTMTGGVNWGDDWITPATVVKNKDGTFSVVAGHTYKHAGTYPITITVDGSKGARLTLSATGISRPTTQLVGTSLFINGTSGKDTITVTKNADGKIHALVNGVDKAFTAASIARLNIFAWAGDDRVTIGHSVPGSFIAGDSGNDTLMGGDGNDSLTAGSGKNTLIGAAGDDRLASSNGNDLLQGGGGNDRMYGNGGSDRLDGGAGTDRLFGGDGNDLLSGGAGLDRMYGQAGNDTMNGGLNGDIADGGAGTDTVFKDVLDATPLNVEVIKNV